MLKLKINDKEIEVEEGLTILQACEVAGEEIPRFCYHERLSIAGNCRMCLVEMEKSPKPVASCAMPAADGMNIKTNTPFVEKARKGVMEFLLVNHPLDCPVCDQGGECDLQDQSMFYGVDKSRFKENKRYVPDKYMGPLIKTQMTRCIHCTRCVRFATEIAGVPELGAIGRGEDMQITTYLEKAMESELSANVVDLCPVGALTSKPYVFEARPWELKKTETIDVMDAVGSSIRVDTYGWEVKRILPRNNDDINEEWISDKTRYACDGLKNQRLDAPFVKINGKFEKISWNEAYKILTKKIENTPQDKIAGIIGDLTDMETMYVVKEFFDKTIKSSNLDCRTENIFVDNSNRSNYIFNPSINGIEQSDLIVMIGANPRYEATMLNARIRKSFLNNDLSIFSYGNVGELTYPYKLLPNNTSELISLAEEKNEISKKIISAKKPIIIFGQSFFKLKSAEILFEKLKNFLIKNSKINEEWNPIGIISNHSSTVGAYDLDIVSPVNYDSNTVDDIKNNLKEFIFLFGQDNLVFKKKNEFIVYIGTHGDKGAEISDLILPGAAYTEKEGHYTNLEGKLQKTYKGSYPPGEAKEDWEIINNLSELLKRKKLFKNKNELVDSMKNYLKLKKEKKLTPSNKIKKEIINETIRVNEIDYYYSNVITRASKTMSECRNNLIKLKNTGTDG